MKTYNNLKIAQLLLFVALSFLSILQAESIKNPIAPNGNDPWIIKKDNIYYYCYAQSGKLWINSHKTIQGACQYRGELVWTPPAGKHYSHNIWAPELLFIRGYWYIYFAADNGDNANHRMYVLKGTSSNPTGKYIFKGKVSDSTNRWAIDGTVLEYGKELYFVWSGWEGFHNVQQNIYIAKMSSPTKISGERILISRPKYNWERIGRPLINEGPQIIKNGNDVFVIYSASGSWTDDYCLGQLRLVGKDPLQAQHWEKTRTPVFSGTGGIVSPGHASFTKSPDDTEDWIVYHTAKHRGAGWNRDVNMKKFTWDIDGNPVFGYPESKRVAMPMPSGTCELFKEILTEKGVVEGLPQKSFSASSYYKSHKDYQPHLCKYWPCP
ncbi:MAG: glycoside hydrolase family 43 protein [Planctomycetes bacterium]|nr:glycoside hydrolase family 43 protein [Planctomycetota bacterium]